MAAPTTTKMVKAKKIGATEADEALRAVLLKTDFEDALKSCMFENSRHTYSQYHDFIFVLACQA
jgi:hypothetical protein